MSDAMETVEAKRGITRTEHVLKSVLNGGLESVRLRLIRALEQLEYHVVSDEPLHARRPARGLARYYLSANILEYPTKLTIGLREIGPDSTLATLDYISEHPGSLSFKGDLHTQMREAEAVIAIARSEQTLSACSSCGTGQISEGRFCRVCGAPTVHRELAELEILRVTAGARAGHHLIVTGVFLAILGFLATLGLVLIAGLAGVPLGVSLGVLAAGLIILFMGMAGLGKTLDRGGIPSTGQHSAPTTAAQPDLLTVPASVTEGTTSLLNAPANAREIDPVPVKDRSTSPLDP